MKIFKSIPDLQQLQGDPIRAAVESILSPLIADPAYAPEDDGYVVLIESADMVARSQPREP